MSEKKKYTKQEKHEILSFYMFCCQNSKVLTTKQECCNINITKLS